MKNLTPPTQKYCRKGKHMVDIDKFYKHVHGDGLFNMCIDCTKEARKERKQKAKEGTIKAL